MTVTIRTASAADGTALAAVDRATWSAAVSPAPPPQADAAFFRPDKSPADTLVAVSGELVVGYIA